MKLKHILFGEDVIDVNLENPVQEDQPKSARMALVNPTLNFIPQFIPSTFSFSALIMMQGAPEKDTSIRIELQNVDNNKTIFSVASFVPQSIPRNPILPPDLAGLNINVPLKNVPIEFEGKYILSVYFDGDFAGSEEIAFIRNS